MKLSIIIPTHNRSKSLIRTLGSLERLKNEALFECIVVDNNSSDETNKIANLYPGLIKYIYEPNTSFTKARKTGEEKSTGEILLYLDDDLILQPGSLKEIVRIFSKYQNCGVIAGKILPEFITKPPKWTLECQNKFNAWSLYNPKQLPELKKDFQEVEWAAGPLLAVKHDILRKAGGFPPDTIGVEADTKPETFSKLYIGPGDYGLCYKVRKIGYKVYYSSMLSGKHLIYPIRMTIGFWRSRAVGEGYHHAVSDRAFFKLTRIELLRKHLRYEFQFRHYEQLLLTRLSKLKKAKKNNEGISPEELWLLYYKAYLDMDRILNKYPGLWQFLWQIGYEGVSDDNYDMVINKFPIEFKKVVSDDFAGGNEIIKSVIDYNEFFRDRRYYKISNKYLKLKRGLLFLFDRLRYLKIICL